MIDTSTVPCKNSRRLIKTQHGLTERKKILAQKIWSLQSKATSGSRRHSGDWQSGTVHNGARVIDAHGASIIGSRNGDLGNLSLGRSQGISMLLHVLIGSLFRDVDEIEGSIILAVVANIELDLFVLLVLFGLFGALDFWSSGLFVALLPLVSSVVVLLKTTQVALFLCDVMALY